MQRSYTAIIKNKKEKSNTKNKYSKLKIEKLLNKSNDFWACFLLKNKDKIQ